jgi:hypothetical protein
MTRGHSSVGGYALGGRAAIHTCGAEFCFERSLPAAVTSTPLGFVTSVAAGIRAIAHAIGMITVNRSIMPPQIIIWPRYNHDRRCSAETSLRGRDPRGASGALLLPRGARL